MQMGDSPSPSRREELLQGRRGASYDSCLLSSSISSLADRRQRLQDVVGCDVVRHAQFRSSGSLSASDFVDTSAGCLPTKLMAAASAEEPKLLPPPGVDVCHDQQAGRSAHNNNLKHNGMVATGSRVPLLATTSTPKRVLSGRGVAAHHQQELCVKFNGGAAASSSLRANALDVTFDVAIEAPPSSSAARSRRNTNDSRRSSYDGSSVGGVRTHRFASQGSGFLMDSLVGGAYLSGSKGEDTFADYSPRPHQHDNHQPSSGHHQHHPLTETSLKSAIEHLRRHQQQQQLQRIRSRDSRMTSSSSAHQLLRQSSALSRTLSGRGLVFTGTVAGGGATSRSSVNSRSAERLQGGGDYFEHVMDNMGDHDGEGDMVKRASSNALLTMASEGGASSNCEIVSLLFSDGEELYSGAREGAGIRGTIRAATMPERDGVELHLEAELLQSEDEEDTQTALHNAGLCKPCAFYYSKKTGCRNADSCEFCHHKDHARLTLKQWKKRQQKLVKQGNTTTELSGATTDGTTTTPPANGIPATASPAVDPSAPPASSSSSSTSAAPPDLAAVNTSPTARPEPETTTASMMTSTTSTMTNPNHQGFGQEEPSNHSSPFPNPTPADAKYDDNAGTPVAGYTVGINTGGIHTGGVILPAGMGMDAGKGHASLLGFSSGGVESAWPNSLGSGMYHHAAGGVYAAGGQGLPPMAPPYHHPPHLHRHPHRPHHRHPHHPHHHHHHQNQFSSISSSSGQQGLPSSDLPPSPHGWTPLGTDHSFSPPASRPVLPPVSSGAFGGYGGVDPHMSMVAGYESGGAAGYDDQQQYNINGSMFPPGGMHSRANLGVRMAGLSPAGSSGNFATQQSPGRNANIDRVMQQSPAVFREVWGNGGADGHRYHHGVLPPVGGQPPPPPPNQLHFEGDGRMSHHQRLFFKDARGINTGDDITGRNTTAGGMELRVHYPQQHQPFQTNVNDLSLSNVLHGAGGVSHLVPAHRKGFSTGAVNSPPGMSGGGGIYTAPPPNFSSRNQHSGRMVAGGGRMAHPAPPLPLTPPAAASGGLPQFSTCQQHQQPPVQHQQKKWHNDQLRQHQQHQHQPANRPRGGREGDQQIKSPSSASRSTTTSTTSYAAAVAAPPSSPSVSSELN